MLCFFPVYLSVQTCLLNPNVQLVSQPWSSGAQISFISCEDGYDYFRRDSIPGRVSTSGIATKHRPSRTFDLRTMVEVVSERLTSPERVTTGVGVSSRAAVTETDSLHRLLRSTLHVGTVSMVFSEFPR